jgi:hypothetical protein
MPSINLSLADTLSPEEIFAEMPSNFRSYLSRGFEQIAELDQSKIGQLADVLAEGHAAMEEAGVNEILRRLELNVRDKDSFGSALGVLTILVASRKDIGEVITAGEKAGAIPAASANRLVEIATELSRGRAVLTDVLKTTSLANAIAPSFQKFAFSVELRFGFEDAKIARNVPIAICHLVTDDDDVHSLFQMTKSDVAELISQLQKIESQFAAIEEWSRGQK